MWITDSTDFDHNMFGLKVERPKRRNSPVHDPFVLYKSPYFDMIHYTTLDSIKIMDKDRRTATRILSDIGKDSLMELTPEEAEKFLSKFLGREVTLHGIESGYDKILREEYYIFYYVELL